MSTPPSVGPTAHDREVAVNVLRRTHGSSWDDDVAENIAEALAAQRAEIEGRFTQTVQLRIRQALRSPGSLLPTPAQQLAARRFCDNHFGTFPENGVSEWEVYDLVARAVAAFDQPAMPASEEATPARVPGKAGDTSG